MTIVCSLTVQADPRALLMALEPCQDLALVMLQGQAVLTWGAVAEVPVTADWQSQVRALVAAEAPPEGLAFAGGVIGHLAYEAGRFCERMPAAKGSSITGDGLFRRYPGALLHTPKGWVAAGEATWVYRAKQRVEALPALAPAGAPSAQLSNIPPDVDFAHGVQEILARIAAGECYQVNLSRALSFDSDERPAALFARLPLAAHGAFLRLRDSVLMSESPELFWRLHNGQIQTRPIKGTAPLGEQAALLADPKEKAELTMIVDLMRNDLGRVCLPGTVQTQARRVLALPTLLHAEQQITGTLLPTLDAVDLMDATFPPGSVTGAPKVQAMSLINHLEPVVRGAYTGAIGAFVDGGDAEFSVAIRVAQWRAHRLTVHVGCGVVADSDPQRETQESWLKAQAWMGALGLIG
ncbi:MAG: anthranilate/para-aminobenzoate synthase component I [Cognaticolwellia sp.]|jgi:anthranilate/para-aminobenzoate synthase component I